ncbi:MAG: NUDIX hydrolase [Anaerolineae bacterium]|jgi:ADP-ribose pyrophosphatase
MPVWETLSRRYLWQSQWYNVQQDQVRTRDGHIFTYTVIEHPGAVWVVPITADGQVVLIRSYRYPVDDWCYEVPAGGLLPDLTPEEVAHRELLEEVGGTAAALHHVGQFYTSNGISNEVAYVYLAKDVELGESQPEPTELVEMHLVPVEQALRMAREGAITDGPSALALLWCEELLGQ